MLGAHAKSLCFAKKKTWFSRDSAAHHISKNQNKCQQGKKKSNLTIKILYIYMFEFRILICAHVKGIIDFDTRLRCCTHSHLSRIFICASALYNYICGEIATTQNSQFIYTYAVERKLIFPST